MQEGGEVFLEDVREVTVILSEGVAEVEESPIKPDYVIVRSFDYALRAPLRMTDTNQPAKLSFTYAFSGRTFF